MTKARIDTSNKIVREIFEVCKAQEISDMAITAALDVHLNTVRNWRNGKTSPPISEVMVLASVLGYEITLNRVL